ncbi:hypothetical protein AVEN_65329-1 [Araneus ventricosus]|uniref:Uncharacterized protein n=1 Tax=Araneus ventricosus TaxID=182803 RepID=A0A4Y2AG06_ARAVE|nr:hypothetical protein AVEN_65329-1 [Araneus ventricosus]
MTATRGLFWDGPRNFEPWSDDQDVIGAGHPTTPSFHAISAEKHFTSTDLTYLRPHLLGGSLVESDLEPVLELHETYFETDLSNFQLWSDGEDS